MFPEWIWLWLLFGVASMPKAADLSVVAAWDFNTPGVLRASQGSGEARTLGGVSTTNLTGAPSDSASPNASLAMKGFPPQGTAVRSAGMDFVLEGAFSMLQLTFDVRVSPTACSRLAVLVGQGGGDFVEAGTLNVMRDSVFVPMSLDLTGVLDPLQSGPTRIRIVADVGSDGLYPTAKPRSDGTDPYSPLGVWRLDQVVFRGVVREAVENPLPVSVSLTKDGLALEWSNPGADRFTLWRSASSGGPWTSVGILYDTRSLEPFDGPTGFYRVTSP